MGKKSNNWNKGILLKAEGDSLRKKSQKDLAILVKSIIFAHGKPVKGSIKAVFVTDLLPAKTKGGFSFLYINGL